MLHHVLYIALFGMRIIGCLIKYWWCGVIQASMAHRIIAMHQEEGGIIGRAIGSVQEKFITRILNRFVEIP